MKQTQVSLDLSIGPAAAEDYASAAALLRQAGLPVAGVREHFDHFFVLRNQGAVIGICGLEMYGDRALLRSLVVAEAMRGLGLGRRLYRYTLEQAVERGVFELILLTETAEGFFARLGFEVIARAQAHAAVQASVEFREACPDTAVCMRLRLA